MLVLPFTADQDEDVRCFVSLLLRPLVCPAAGRDPEKTMEIRFVAPGSLVSNLDFVESIFGNAGDPYLPENDAALDALHWTGHTGCVVLAPHLVGMKKKDVGLPHISEATERQRRDGMCWENEDELYNGGSAFKITCRDQRGVMVTILADNYYGYCKKEVKTQISFAANLFGMCEEEHAGGAIAFRNVCAWPGISRRPHRQSEESEIHRCDRSAGRSGGTAGRKVMPQDRRFSDIYYVPEDAVFHVLDGNITWRHGDRDERLTLRKDATYFLPNGFRIRLEKQTGRDGLAIGGRAAARHAVSQTMHCVGRRQVGDFEVHRQRAAERSGVRQRLSPRHGPSGRDFRTRFFGIYRGEFRTRGPSGRS